MIFEVLIHFAISTSREKGIRTLDTVTHILAFQASSFNHSDTSLFWFANNIKKSELEKPNCIFYDISPLNEVSNTI